MNDKPKTSDTQSRRQFMKLLSGGSLLCLGCGHLCAAPMMGQKGMGAGVKHSFQNDSKMSFEEVFDFAYMQQGYKFKLLLDKLEGEEKKKFLEAVKLATIESTVQEAKDMLQAVNNKNDFNSYISEMVEPNYFIRGILTYDIVEHKEKAFEVRITECLTQKIFRKHNATELGYHMFCVRDFHTARNFNPKIKLIRDKTLMQGYDCCNHRWEYEG